MYIGSVGCQHINDRLSGKM